ncbi:MAG: response regulator [Zoogloeaceae bacterium]|nr:response regulator [Rhodocyclaceae bacterium]MCP5232626.1 response regulator [Zoogloeaceae bacterium]MCP5240693.1 response regulator [Zoogloeaceae bacterium]MCP5253195.1 response regulator [Zoogloeaceae bacterium]MCP5293452.1 response regulator [Zoogloeaceae bacterium]
MKRLLVVDDMDVMRSVVSTIARECDFDVSQASNGEQALQALAAKRFDAVLSDWNMPRMNGEELVRELRARGATMPVIMITAEADRSKLEALVAIGVQGYILKPFKPEALRKALLALHARLKNTPA